MPEEKSLKRREVKDKYSRESTSVISSGCLPINLAPAVIPQEPLTNIRSFHEVICPVCGRQKNKLDRANGMSAWSGRVVLFRFECPVCDSKIMYGETVSPEFSWNPLGYQRDFEMRTFRLIEEFMSNKTYRKELK